MQLPISSMQALQRGHARQSSLPAIHRKYQNLPPLPCPASDRRKPRLDGGSTGEGRTLGCGIRRICACRPNREARAHDPDCRRKAARQMRYRPATEPASQARPTVLLRHAAPKAVEVGAECTATLLCAEACRAGWQEEGRSNETAALRELLSRALADSRLRSSAVSTIQTRHPPSAAEREKKPDAMRAMSTPVSVFRRPVR